MDDDFKASVLKAPKKYRYNIVQMYLKGHKGYQENLKALTMNQNNVDKAIKAKQPSEVEILSADLKAWL